MRYLARWSALTDPQPGYTIVIGCNAALSSLLCANLTMLRNQERRELQEIIISLDQLTLSDGRVIETFLKERFPDLPLRCIGYTPIQAWLLGTIGWGWTYAWLSWCRAIAVAQTRYVILHDLDAMPINPNVFTDRYEAIRKTNVQYCGVRYYEGNGVEISDGLVTTFEMIFDAQFVRQRFKPLDLFNHVTTYHGRTVDFDTFLYAQSRAGKRGILKIPEDEMVHPSQMICQYTYLMNRKGYIPPVGNNLPLLAYFNCIGGDKSLMVDQTVQLRQASSSQVQFLGKQLNMSLFRPKHAAWITKQAGRLESHLFGQIRPPVSDYLDALNAFSVRFDTSSPDLKD